MNNKALPTRSIPRIVLLEDEKLLCRLMEQCLHEWFARIDIVKLENGDDAWQELLRMKPDLLILDWKHPGLTGEEILHRLALDKAAFPVLLTSELFWNHVQLFSKHGLKLKFLPKPFHIWELWDSVNELLGPIESPERPPLVEVQLETQLPA